MPNLIAIMMCSFRRLSSSHLIMLTLSGEKNFIMILQLQEENTAESEERTRILLPEKPENDDDEVITDYKSETSETSIESDAQEKKVDSKKRIYSHEASLR